jgi:SAM-dependent methyltransferase
MSSNYGGYDRQEFIAEFYDAEYSDPGLHRGDDVGFYVECSRTAGGRTLELGCGTGRVLVPTAIAGFKITGFDLSEFMLNKCREKLVAQPEGVRRRVRLAQGSMVDFNLGETFSLVTIPFRPFQHIVASEEQKSCLRCIRRHLAPGGRLVFDVFNPRLDRLYDPKYTVEAEDLPEKRLPDGRLLRRNSRLAGFHRDLQYNDIELVYYVKYPDGRSDRLVQAFPMRYFFRYELEHLLELCGFKVVDLFGDFDGSAFSADSPQMVFVATAA